MAEETVRKRLFLLALHRSRSRRIEIRRLMSFLASRRRRLISLVLVLSLLPVSNRVATPRSCRRLTRNVGWWRNVCNYSNKRFKQTFGVSRNTFDYILGEIRHRLVKETKAEEPVSPEFRLAICLYRLGRGDYMYTIAEMAGLGVSTVCCIIHEVCQAIVDEMWEGTVSKLMPKTADEFREKILDMEEQWQFPCSWAAVDGCHIPLKCPPGGMESQKEYHNFKNFYSLVLMAMVDAKYRFVWGSCGFPGNSHDSTIFQSTNLWSSIENGYIPDIGKAVEDVPVQPLILGDSAFPHTTWLMKPYGDAVLTKPQRYYNYRLSRARMIVEGAYGQLKGRWRVLLRKCESTRDEVRGYTLACMVLHNLCIEKGDTMSKALDLTVDPVSQRRRNRNDIRALLNMTDCKKNKDTSKAAKKVRDALCRKLWQEKMSGQIC